MEPHARRPAQESRALQRDLLGSEAMAYKGQVTPFKLYKSVLLPFLKQYVPHIDEQVANIERLNEGLTFQLSEECHQVRDVTVGVTVDVTVAATVDVTVDVTVPPL